MGEVYDYMTRALLAHLAMTQAPFPFRTHRSCDGRGWFEG